MIADLETIDRLAGEASRESADKLQELEHTTAEREIRKAARKALYRLSQAGIVPNKRQFNAGAERAGTYTLRAFASAYDGAGNRLILFLVPDPDGGSATLLKITTNDTEGVTNCEILKIQRRELDQRVNWIVSQADTGIAVAEIDPDYGRRLLARSRSLSASLSKRSPAEVLTWIGKIGEPIGEYAPPFYTRVAREEIRGDASIPTDPAELFKLIWFEPWYFAAEETMPWLPQWELAVTDAGENADFGPGSQVYQIASEAAAGLMTDAMCSLYVIRLEETADVLWRCGKEVEAKQAAYHALALESGGDMAAIPFVHEIALRTLGAAFEVVRLHRERRAGG